MRSSSGGTGVYCYVKPDYSTMNQTGTRHFETNGDNCDFRPRIQHKSRHLLPIGIPHYQRAACMHQTPVHRPTEREMYSGFRPTIPATSKKTSIPEHFKMEDGGLQACLADWIAVVIITAGCYVRNARTTIGFSVFKLALVKQHPTHLQRNLSCRTLCFNLVRIQRR